LSSTSPGSWPRGLPRHDPAATALGPKSTGPNRSVGRRARRDRGRHYRRRDRPRLPRSRGEPHPAGTTVSRLPLDRRPEGPHFLILEGNVLGRLAELRWCRDLNLLRAGGDHIVTTLIFREGERSGSRCGWSQGDNCCLWRGDAVPISASDWPRAVTLLPPERQSVAFHRDFSEGNS
jgi:hypothetical protein